MFEISNLNVFYGVIHALKDVSLTVQEGEIVTLIGSNGAGKTTTLRAISGITPAKSGEIRFLGQNIEKVKATKIVKMGISHVPEGRRIFPDMSVLENLQMGAYLRRDREGIRELTKPLFAIPPHQFIFNCGSIDKRFYMDLLQLEEAEYNLIRFPQRGVCLFKCGNERYLLEVHAPAYKEALFGTAGGR